uniref:Failed axon connections homolog n=1 Tax=Panagrellus redivivus TaxID=6233 RepID=A0A7E4VM98_PANRE
MLTQNTHIDLAEARHGFNDGSFVGSIVDQLFLDLQDMRFWNYSVELRLLSRVQTFNIDTMKHNQSTFFSKPLGIMTRTKLQVPGWLENTVYLVQFPRPAGLPNLSPFCLKVENFLRVNNIPHQIVEVESASKGPRGQLPFIELNGCQFPDSSHIINVLTEKFHLRGDSNLTKKDKADIVAYTFLVEHSLLYTLLYFRSKGVKWMFGDQYGLKNHFTGIKKTLVPIVGPGKLGRKIKSIVNTHGIGRLGIDDVIELGKKDLLTLNALLGDKSYFFGEEPTSFDSTAFGLLTELLLTPQPDNRLIKFANDNTKLSQFLNRVKAAYWPDWPAPGVTMVVNPTLPVVSDYVNGHEIMITPL